MIKFTCELDGANIEAIFNTIDELDEFRRLLDIKKAARAKELQALEDKIEDDRQHTIEARWQELKSDSRNFVNKAKSYGVTPEGVFDIIKCAVLDAAEDRCLTDDELRVELEKELSEEKDQQVRVN